jgi:hypothetical protein
VAAAEHGLRRQRRPRPPHGAHLSSPAQHGPVGDVSSAARSSDGGASRLHFEPTAAEPAVGTDGSSHEVVPGAGVVLILSAPPQSLVLTVTSLPRRSSEWFG